MACNWPRAAESATNPTVWTVMPFAASVFAATTGSPWQVSFPSLTSTMTRSRASAAKSFAACPSE
jgi:hypothetical protein